MKIYLSSALPLKGKIKTDNFNELLVAFPGLLNPKSIERLDGINDLFLDSGGFSIRQSGLELNIEDYKNFIIKYGNKFSVIANMDTLSEEESEKNLSFLESTGHYILPVYHYGDKLDTLEEMCKKYNYIGLGGLAGVKKSKKDIEKFLKYCFFIGMKYKTKFHGFGITSFSILLKYPFYSVDSTSWQSFARFNNLVFFKNGKFYKTNAKKSRDLFGVDFSKLKNYEKFSLGFQERDKMRNYITNLHKVKKMDYRNY